MNAAGACARRGVFFTQALLCALVACTLASVGACTRASDAADQALWRLVDSQCHDGPQAGFATAEPAQRAGVQCDLALGYAVLKDQCGATHYLLLPTARRVGIESPELLRTDEPNYLALAWAQRGRSLAAMSADSASGPAAVPPEQAGDPAERADLGLAINSRYGRSQAQLHVHIDLVRPEVRAALAALPRPVPAGTRVELMGHRYRVDPLDSLSDNAIERLARLWDAHTQEERARLTLAVVGDGGNGLLLLSDRADLLALDRGHAEELLRERRCR